MPTGALTALAADEPDGSPAATVCLWLARALRRGATEGAAKDIQERPPSTFGNIDMGEVVVAHRRPEVDRDLARAFELDDIAERRERGARERFDKQLSHTELTRCGPRHASARRRRPGRY